MQIRMLKQREIKKLVLVVVRNYSSIPASKAACLDTVLYCLYVMLGRKSKYNFNETEEIILHRKIKIAMITRKCFRMNLKTVLE